MIYIVRYSKYSYDDYAEYNLFATFDRDKAYAYKDKYNRILEGYREFLDSFCVDTWSGGRILKKEYWDAWYDRLYAIRDINECFVEETEVR